MPTGYTADLYDGKEVDFPTFVLTCARAFGATVLLRDSSISVLPTEENVKEGDYTQEKLEAAKAKLDRFIHMEDAELERLTQEANEEARVALEKSLEENERRSTAYLGMIAQVEAWTPPSPDHEGLKEFMLEQLRDSLKHDCHEDDYIRRWHPQYTTRQFRANQIDSAARDIAYHREQVGKVRERNEGREKWVRDLRKSLGLEGA